MVFASNLGYPRIGVKRELKTALEQFWAGRSTEEELINTGKELRLAAWTFQKATGLDFIPSNDFSLYDHVLDTIAMVGAIPKRFQWIGNSVDLNTYFLMARGISAKGNSIEAPAMEMTKWFNTNYHFIVPELEEDQKFNLSSTKCVDEFLEAKAAGILTRPVLLGPVTFLNLAKGQQVEDQNYYLDQLIEVYREVFSLLRKAGAQWIQIDEPCLSADLNDRAAKAFTKVYENLAAEKLSILLTTYFDSLGRNLSWAVNLPVNGIHLDLINGMADLEPILKQLPDQMSLSAGVVDGHNVWRCSLAKTSELLQRIADKIGPERLIVAPSCSLMHAPIDVNVETQLSGELKSWLSFAKQKVEEIQSITSALRSGQDKVEKIFQENSATLLSASNSEIRNNASVKSRIGSISPAMCKRTTPFDARYKLQQQKLTLPLLPTTTIGSFPQTKQIRDARKNLRAGNIDREQYEQAMRNEISNNISLQEKIGIDVLVHGEPERTDMVEYFAEMLNGVAVTQHGWVQSYGSRYVKPPLIYGDVSRPTPMTIKWSKFAQEQTRKPVKGMLTGPVTMLKWSFVRNDQPQEKTCTQLAFAIRDEVMDLESAGIKVIQIDEPAIREGLPLKRSDWQDYLEWATKCFRLASSGVKDETQIHTHMCYSEFGDIVEAIASMDADVISIEAARSSMDLLDVLREKNYPNAIGPGVYDIHSPRVPTMEEMEWLLKKALQVIPADRLWVNPDCGLKTRNWDEVIPSLNVLVQTAIALRQSLANALQSEHHAGFPAS